MPQGTDGLLCLCIDRVRQNRHTPLIPLRVLRLVPGSYISGAGFRAVEDRVGHYPWVWWVLGIWGPSGGWLGMGIPGYGYA